VSGEIPLAIVPVVVTPEFFIGLERQGGVTLVHCSVWRWGAGVARVLRASMDGVIAAHGGPLYAAAVHPHGGDFVKLHKFCRWMGFEPWGVALGHPVWVRWE